MADDLNPQAGTHIALHLQGGTRRMLELKELSTHELSHLCREAGEVRVRRFTQIAEAADPTDRPLQELLAQMAQMPKVAELPARAVPDGEERQSPESLPFRKRGELMELLRSYLTSLSKGFGEGRLHRDIALFLAESLEEEAARLYRALAEHAPERRTRALLLDLSECERGNLRFLREVVLESEIGLFRDLAERR
jgi:hypothetical protein